MSWGLVGTTEESAPDPTTLALAVGGARGTSLVATEASTQKDMILTPVLMAKALAPNLYLCRSHSVHACMRELAPGERTTRPNFNLSQP